MNNLRAEIETILKQYKPLEHQECGDGCAEKFEEREQLKHAVWKIRHLIEETKREFVKKEMIEKIKNNCASGCEYIIEKHLKEEEND